MDKKHAPASSLAIIFNILIAMLSFFMIDQITDNHPWVEVSLFMAWGTFFLIRLTRLLTKGHEGVAMLGAYILIFTGSTLGAIFLIWVGNSALKLLNSAFIALDWTFQIGNLFPGVYNFAASVPSLICGLIMAFVAFGWENKNYSKKWLTPFLTGKSFNE